MHWWVSVHAFVGLFTSTLRITYVPMYFLQGDNKAVAEAEDEERGRKEKDGEEMEQDGDKVAGREGQGFSSEYSCDYAHQSMRCLIKA